MPLTEDIAKSIKKRASVCESDARQRLWELGVDHIDVHLYCTHSLAAKPRVISDTQEPR